MTESVRIERLATHHDRAPFDCGNEPLNIWLKSYASQYAKRDLAVAYVLVDDSRRSVIGYYSLSCHAVHVEEFPAEHAKGVPNISVPVLLLGRFAVDRSLQGQGFGRRLLLDALHRCVELSEQIGLRAMEVDAIDSSACEFYRTHSFISFPNNANHLFIPVKMIRSVFPSKSK